jgi:hypothetical protein
VILASQPLGVTTARGRADQASPTARRYVLLRAANDNPPPFARWLIDRAARSLLYLTPLLALIALWYWAA